MENLDGPQQKMLADPGTSYRVIPGIGDRRAVNASPYEGIG